MFPAVERLMRADGVFEIDAKIDLYFVDFGIVPLFVQENYMTPIPNFASTRGQYDQNEHMTLLSLACDKL